MKLIASDFGKFESIEKLHSRFTPDNNYLKITLDLDREDDLNPNQVKRMLENIRKIFPMFDHHKCCTDEWSGYDNPVDSGSNIQIGNVIDDTAHLFEHILIETTCTIGGLDSVSGITCGYHQPRNRFDLFIECPDRGLGIFALNFCYTLIKKMLKGRYPAKLFGKFTEVNIRDLVGDPAPGKKPGCRVLIERFLIPPPVFDNPN
jgi:hypothetical protein